MEMPPNKHPALLLIPGHLALLQPLDLSCFGPEKRRYREDIRRIASFNDTGMVQKLHLIQYELKAHTEDLSQRNIRITREAVDLVPKNPQEALASS